VPNFVDELLVSSSFDVNAQGYLKQDVGEHRIVFFLRFWPNAQLISPMLSVWKLRATQMQLRGLTALDEPSFFAFIATKLFLGVTGLSNAKHIWENKVPLVDTSCIRSHLSYTFYKSMNRVLAEVGFDSYKVGDELPDGRLVPATDSLAKIRKFGDKLQEHWRSVYVPGTALTIDESMIS
jgi:hypothetical protein